MPQYEISQATGAQTQIIYCKEADWGVSPTSGYKALNVVGGESLDDNIQTYKSGVIKSDRSHNPTVRGTRKPGGSLPFELAPVGFSQFFWQALGGTPAVTNGSGTGTVGTAPQQWNVPPTGYFKHVIKAAQTLPFGFTLEKGFLDLGTVKYYAMTGCKIDKWSIRAGVDKVVDGTFDIMSRTFAESGTSVTGTNAITVAPLTNSFTSVQMGIYDGTNVISVCQDLTLNFSNNFHDNSFVLGSNFRQNLKPGTRMVDGNAQFLFSDATYYDKSISGTQVALRILAQDGGNNSIEFWMPNVQLLPRNTSPKIQNDGPLTINADFEALFDNTAGTNNIGTDLQMTIVSTEATVNY